MVLMGFDSVNQMIQRIAIMILNVDNLSFPLQATPDGPLLSTEDSYWERSPITHLGVSERAVYLVVTTHNAC